MIRPLVLDELCSDLSVMMVCLETTINMFKTVRRGMLNEYQGGWAAVFNMCGKGGVKVYSFWASHGLRRSIRHSPGLAAVQIFGSPFGARRESPYEVGEEEEGHQGELVGPAG